MLRHYVVMVEQPEEVTDEEMREYIEGAVAEMKGCKHPDDPIFDLNGDSVQVERYEDAIQRELEVLAKIKEYV